VTRDTFTFFEHCRGSRFDQPWRIMSQTCHRCGITYAVGSEVIVASARMCRMSCWAFEARRQIHGIADERLVAGLL
jgi:hypothetical protein